MVKNTLANVEEVSSVPGSRRSPGEGNGYPVKYSYLRNPMDRGAWWVTCRRLGHELATEHTHIQMIMNPNCISLITYPELSVQFSHSVMSHSL